MVAQLKIAICAMRAQRNEKQRLRRAHIDHRLKADTNHPRNQLMLRLVIEAWEPRQLALYTCHHLQSVKRLP